MGIREFKYRVDLIMSFVVKVNKEDIPVDIKKTIVKAYANTLRINLSDSMAYNIIAITDSWNVLSAVE